MSDLLFKINAGNCEVNLPKILFWNDEDDNAIILRLDIEKDGDHIIDCSIESAVFFEEKTYKETHIAVEPYMFDEAVKAIQVYDESAFIDRDFAYESDYDRYGVAAWQFI